MPGFKLTSWSRWIRSAGSRRPIRRLHLETLEERSVPTVTAVNEAFAATPNTPTALEVLGPANAASTETVALAGTGAVSPSGPTLVQNADGSLTFNSPSVGIYSFGYTATGAPREITGSNGASNAFGGAVAISGDMAVVGALHEAVGANTSQGVATVFTKLGNLWVQLQTLTGSGGAANDDFGGSVAISGDTLVIGAADHKVGNNTVQGAAYVFTFNGTSWSQQQVLTASDGKASDFFGGGVAIDGDTIVVGADGHQVGGNAQQGAGYVFTRSGTTWTQQAELLASDGKANDEFGYSVALSGGTAVIGAVVHPSGGNFGAGAAYVFTGSGSSWSQQQELTASDGGVNENFGYSVAVSGNTALVCSPYQLLGSSNQGAAYVFTRSGTTWSQQAELRAADGATNDLFGTSVSLDGNTAVVGAADHEVGSNMGQGAAYVFVFSGSTWVQQQELTAPDGVAGDVFGIGVGVSGSTVISGAAARTVAGNSGQGAAYIQDISESTATATVNVAAQAVTAANDSYVTAPGTATTLNVLANDTNPQGTGLAIAAAGAVSPTGPTLTRNTNGTFTFTSASTGTYSFNYTAGGQQQAVTPSDGVAGEVSALAVAIDGNTAVIGGPGHGSDQGAVYVFVLSGSTWTQQAELTAGDGAAGDAFGISVAVSGDTIVVGAEDHKVGSNADQGAAYVFTRSGATWSQQAELTASDGNANDLFGGAVAVSGDTIAVAADQHKVGSNNDQGAVYVFVSSGTNWTQQQELHSADGGVGDNFGRDVAVQGDTLVVGAWEHKVGSNVDQGAVYVFARSASTWSLPQELTSSDGATDDSFGTSVALSGNTVVVGAEGKKIGSNAAEGAAYVFVRSSTTWTQQQELNPADGGANDSFGASVAVSGSVIVVGANDHTGASSEQGAAYVFTRSGTTWTQQQELTAADAAANDSFGFSVAISGDAVIVGAPAHKVGGNTDEGAAYFENVSQATATVTVRVTVPTALTATSGGGQSALVNTAFANALTVTVTDTQGFAAAGALVTFAGPASGAGLTFPNGNTATTNAQGQATLIVNANGNAGAFAVTASVAGITPMVNFSLTNDAPPVVAPIGPQTVTDGTALAFTATATSPNGNPLTFSLASGAPAGASINAQTGAFTWTPFEWNGQAPGPYTVGITATDTKTQLTGSATVAIIVGPSSTDQGSGLLARTAVAVGLTQSAEYYSNIIVSAYNKYLNRGPDANGLAYWVNLMRNGLTDEHLEAGFIGSAEYIADHGGAGAGWVTGMYLNLLGRNPAASEVQYWLTQLAAGMTTADIAYGFAASEERESQHVQADYQQFLGRSASTTEVMYWVNVFLNGGTNEQVIAGFVSSQEYFQTHGNNVVDWLFADYHATLNRLPDQAGYQSWLSQLG